MRMISIVLEIPDETAGRFSAEFDMLCARKDIGARVRHYVSTELPELKPFPQVGEVSFDVAHSELTREQIANVLANANHETRDDKKLTSEQVADVLNNASEEYKPTSTAEIEKALKIDPWTRIDKKHGG